MQNILIIGAHYDDAELGAGGTAAKFAHEGKNVYKITLTDNETNFVQMGIRVASDDSAVQSGKACEVLGIKEITEFEPVPCNHLIYSTELMQRIEKVIYDYQIDTVFMHFSSDVNQDHMAASQLCLTAARHCSNIFQYQSNGYIINQYEPTLFVDISDYIDLKRKALEQYGEAHNRFNRLFETSIERNHLWGYANKVEYAEGFHVIKSIIK